MITWYRQYLLPNLVIVLLLCHICGKWQDNELAVLQRAYVFSDSENEREEIIDQLENYFLKMPIPDSLEQKLHIDVETLINEYKIESQASLENYRDEPNIYQVESKFYSLIKSKIISIAKREETGFHNMDSIAFYIDTQLGIEYWEIFYNEVKNYSPEQAKHWLYAQKASQDCKRYLGSFDQLKIGLIYASLGLRHLVDVKDRRIRLDILQRIQYGLYKYYGYHELSIALGNHYLQSCNLIGYKLRANSILYHIATAYFSSGMLSQALERYRIVISTARSNINVPHMDWFIKNGLLCVADTYTWSGNYKNALAVCDTVEEIQLDEKEKLNLYMTRAMINRNLGYYEIAEKNYNLALGIAKSIDDLENKLKIINNIGFMFFELSEYYKALEYYNQALSELKMYSPNSREPKINLLINIGDVYSRLGEFEQVDVFLNQALSELHFLGEHAIRKADLLNTMGKSQMGIDQYKDANIAFTKAESICDNNGLIKLGLKVKINLANSLIALAEYKQARLKISEILSIAQAINDIERQIDAFATMARLDSKEGKYQRAVQASNRLINLVDILSHNFKDSQKLIAYQQKINKYLKEAVLYELKLNRIDSSLIKLDYTKSLAFINNHVDEYDISRKIDKVDINDFLSKLNPNIQIFNYMISEDTLYTFVLNNSGISVIRKNLDYDSLKTLVFNYIKTINRTIPIFENYNETEVNEHYILTTSLSHKLYTALIEDELIDKITDSNNVLYIIPDDFLHFIPFATLVTEEDNELQFLIEKIKIAYLPGVLSLLEYSDNGNGDSINVFLNADPKMFKMNKLISFISNHYPETHILSSIAGLSSKQEILTSIENNYSIYLFAGHSIASSRNSGESYIDISISSSDSERDHSFKLNMRDVHAMNWDRTSLIFLLGCETAGGILYRGIGISGLQSSFLLSGADNVLASLWRIDASQSIQQAIDFFDGYIESNDFVTALQYSQLKAIDNLKSNTYFKHPHPYFWGSYLLSQKTVSL